MQPLPTYAPTLLIVSAVLFGSLGVAIALVWLYRRNRANDDSREREEKAEGRSLELAQKRSKTADETQRPMKNVTPPKAEELPQSIEEPAPSATLDSEEVAPPDFISCDDEHYKEFLHPVPAGYAEKLLEHGALIYGAMASGDEVMRVTSVAQIGVAVDSDELYVLNRAYAQQPAPGAPAKRTVTGEVMEVGRSPYQFDQRNSPSFFVKLSVNGQEQILWGVDLERAMVDGGVVVGDEAEFKNFGNTPVNVRVPKYGPDGVTVVGHETKTVQRNAWSAIKRAVSNSLPDDHGQSRGKPRQR